MWLWAFFKNRRWTGRLQRTLTKYWKKIRIIYHNIYTFLYSIHFHIVNSIQTRTAGPRNEILSEHFISEHCPRSRTWRPWTSTWPSASSWSSGLSSSTLSLGTRYKERFCKGDKILAIKTRYKGIHLLFTPLSIMLSLNVINRRHNRNLTKKAK